MPTRSIGGLREDAESARTVDGSAHVSTGGSTPESGEGSSSSELAELLAEHLQVAALVLDQGGRIALANRAAESLLVAPAGGLHGARAREVLGSHPQLDRALMACRSGAGTTLDLAPSGEGEPALQVALQPIAGGKGGVLLLISADCLDPGVRSVQGSDDDATQRLAALGRLSAGVAHEIRNPLSGIGTNAQVLRRRLDAGDPRLRFVDFILEEVTRLDKIIEDILRFARPPEPRLVTHDLGESVRRALDLACGRIDRAGIAVTVEAEPDLPRAYVDPDQIAQVLLNVVLNAVQAMPGGGQLRIALGTVERFGPVMGRPGRRAGDDEGPPGPTRRFIAIEVRDEGIGIDRADFPKLFEPFFTTRPSGTGLGLSTSQALVRQHGGAISIESERGKGTSVTILIPVEKRRGPR